MMTSGFSEFNLNQKLVQAIDECGYTTPTPIQKQVIPALLAGSDIIGQAKTGTGKTAAFALPILNCLSGKTGEVQALVITPTRELALQVTRSFQTYGKYSHARVLSVYGGQPYGPQISKLKNGVDIVVGTPGRLMDLLKKGFLNLSHLRVIILDEADEMLSMGFIDDIETIIQFAPENRQNALFSATFPPAIKRISDKYLNDPTTFSNPSENLTVDSIEQRYYLVHQKDKLAALALLVESELITRALIFVKTRVGSGELTNELNSRGFPSETLNGDLPQDARERVVSRFKNNQIKILVATDVAARGLDIDDISHVINYDIPEEVELYVHRIGRTGRAGKNGISLSLISPKELWRLRRIEGYTKTRIQRGTLPTEESIQDIRQEQLVDKLIVWLKRGRTNREKEIVARLVSEGYEIEDIAAAALKLSRAGERTRPIRTVIEAEEKQSKMKRKPRKSQGRNHRPVSKKSDELGMVRVMFQKGRNHGVKPNEVISSIAYFADIPGKSLGKIIIQDKSTLVDIPDELVNKVISSSGKIKLKKENIQIQLA
ncbi:DEAD/DEAH box helicase [Chloroflexota bacterium]